MADRQGNPVPPGTQVNFVAESGVLLPASCVVPPVVAATATSAAIPSSSCTVTIKSSETRTANGRVSILAYTAGEEDFVDVNGNNIYDSGDTFTDLGRAFRDDNGQSASGANGVYDPGEFQVPRELTNACTPSGCVGDGVWGVADVRKQATIVFASSTAIISATPSSSGVNARISDINGNSVPTGSTVKATVVDRTSGTANDVTCTLVGADSITVPNTLSPINVNFGVKDCSSGDLMTITVKTPLGLITSRDFVF